MRNFGYFFFGKCSAGGCRQGLRVLLFLVLAGWLCVAQQAEDLYKNARYKEALEALERAEPGDAEGWLLKGKAQYQLGKFKEAADCFERATRLDGESTAAHNWHGRALGMQAEQGNPLRALGLARKARDAFEAAVALDPGNTDAVSDLLSYYLAAPSFLGGGVDKAEALAGKVKGVDAALYALLRAQLAEKAKDYGEAEEWLRKAIEAEPEKLSPLVDLAHYYTRRDRIAEADAVFARAKKLQPDAARLLFEEAKLLVRWGRNPEKARDLLERYQASKRSHEDPSPFDVKQLQGKLEKLESERRKR